MVINYANFVEFQDHRLLVLKKKTFIPPSQGGSTGTLALIGHAVSEKKMFEYIFVNKSIHQFKRTYI